MPESSPPGWRRWLSPLAGRDRTELIALAAGSAIVLLIVAFFLVAAAVVDGDTQAFDTRVLRALRRQDDPSIPIGPAWLQGGALDLTALGSATVLGLATLAVCGFLALQRMSRTAAFVLVATIGGWALNALLKQAFQRPRPDVVPHLRVVTDLSFPSGHAMSSAVIYLTLGALIMRIVDGRLTKFYCLAVAMMLTLLVGASRVYLGVHYPTDVLAGWLMGLFWALGCWLVERRIERRAGLKREQIQGAHV